MTEILYNYPAMLAHVGQMQGYSTALHIIGTDIATEQASLAQAWQGDSGMNYQAWQAQWNDALANLIAAYQAMTQTHESNIMTMNARDIAEGAKWV